MTEPSSPDTPDAKSDLPQSRCKRTACVGIVAFLVFALAAAWFFCPWIKMQRAEPSAELTQMQQRLLADEQKIQELQTRLENIPTQIVAPEVSEKHEAIAHMQSDLATLFSAIDSLGAEVKKTGSAVAQTQQTAQASLASAIAYIQLRAVAGTGRGFAPELSALRAATNGLPAFQEPVARLEPYAAKGVPSFDRLREEFLALEPSANIAIERETAQNWWQRLLAELKGLVSIRPLHGGGQADAFTAAENALNTGDLASALASVKTLPPDAQDVFKDWQTGAEARLSVDAALQDLASRFVATAQDRP